MNRKLFALGWLLLSVSGPTGFCIMSAAAIAADPDPKQTKAGSVMVRSVKTPKVVPIAEIYLGTVPKILSGASAIYVELDRATVTDAEGVIEVEFEQDAPLYVAVSWANDRPGNWTREAMLQPDFLRAGWTLVGELPMRSSSGKLEYRGLYWRVGKRGEKFRIRTRSQIAPMVIVIESN